MGTSVKDSAQNVFKRGVMTFEDYNYSLYNPYILVESQNSKLPASDILHLDHESRRSSLDNENLKKFNQK